MKVILSKSQWEQIGKTAGWIKKANGWGCLSGDLSDVLEGYAIIGLRKKLSTEEILEKIKADDSLAPMLVEEAVTEDELRGCIEDAFKMYQLTADSNKNGLSREAGINPGSVNESENFDLSNYIEIVAPPKGPDGKFIMPIKENERFYDKERHQMGTFVLRDYHNTKLWMLLYDSGEIEELHGGDLKHLLKKK